MTCAVGARECAAVRAVATSFVTRLPHVRGADEDDLGAATPRCWTTASATSVGTAEREHLVRQLDRAVGGADRREPRARISRR